MGLRRAFVEGCASFACRRSQHRHDCIFQIASVAMELRNRVASFRCERTNCAFDEVADVLFPDERIIARGQKFGAVRDLYDEYTFRRYQLAQPAQAAERIVTMLQQISARDYIGSAIALGNFSEICRIQSELPSFEVGKAVSLVRSHRPCFQNQGLQAALFEPIEERLIEWTNAE